MAREITITVGELYANMHDQYVEGLAEQYEERARQNFEDFVHNFNQQLEREREAQTEDPILEDDDEIELEETQ